MLFKATYRDGSHARVEATGWALAAQIALSKQPAHAVGKRAELVRLELDAPGCGAGGDGVPRATSAAGV